MECDTQEIACPEKVAKEPSALLKALEKRLPSLSPSLIKEFIKQGRVLVNGSLAKINTHLSEKASLEVVPKKIFKDGYTIYYEDRHLVVIEKPEGLLSVSTEKETYHTLHSKVKRWYKQAWPVQRLDRETSGVMVFALTEEAKEGLKQQFIEHTIYREYFAILEGTLTGSGTWETPLFEDKNFHVHIGREGDEIGITHYEHLYTKKDGSRIKFVLGTGKKNQIRVQASFMGVPVLGDKKYGNPKPYAKRLMLHAHKLNFIHPVTQKPLAFISPKPFS